MKLKKVVHLFGFVCVGLVFISHASVASQQAAPVVGHSEVDAKSKKKSKKHVRQASGGSQGSAGEPARARDTKSP